MGLVVVLAALLAGLAVVLWGAARPVGTASLSVSEAVVPRKLATLSEPLAMDTASAPVTVTLPLIAQHPNFFDAVGEPGAVAAAKLAPEPGLRGLVVPHHLLAAPVIARGYAAAPSDVTTVFVVGPNHRNEGGAQLTTAAARWASPAGEVSADDDRVGTLADGVGAARNVEVFRDEHSIGAQVYFIRHFLPQAKIVPLILDSYVTAAQAERVGEWLAGHAAPHSLVVFSIDFSHYLPEAQTRRRDIITRRAIETGDLDTISRFTNDNVDSPMSLIAALTFAKAAGLKVQIIENTNSNDFLVVKQPTTTSHFMIELTK